MNNIANINILSNGHKFPYMLQYIKGDDNDVMDIKYEIFDKFVYFDTELKRNLNTWNKYKSQITRDLNITSSIIRLYFPEFSVDTYQPNSNYVLDVYTYIGSTKIALCSVLINKIDALAVPGVKKWNGLNYYEYIDVRIPDPYELIYNDLYKEFREIIKFGEDVNTDVSMLYASLHVVEPGEDWLIDNEYGGAQSVLDITKDISDYLFYNVKWMDDENGVSIKGEIIFNKVYDGDLSEYLEETYKLNYNDFKLTYMLSTDQTLSWYEYITDLSETSYIFNKSDITEFNKSAYGPVSENLFGSWDMYKDGESFVSTVIISCLVEGEWVEKLILKSNKIPITQDKFSKIMIPDNSNYNIIKELYNEDMNIYVTNTIQQSSIKYDIPDNPKSNIIMPVFYKVRDLGSIVIHPEVNENICINLDAYKSKVESFILQIEGVKFNEIGTTTSGTIFKVVGPSLPANIVEGTYYILSQDGDLVTTGKYKYEV